MNEIPWVIKEQTKLKLDILKSYILPWAIILFNQAKKMNIDQRLLYIDGFCGPGTYFKDDSKSSYVDGSPIIVAKIANDMIDEDLDRNFEIICIDKENKCLELLKPALQQLNKHNQKWITIKQLFEKEIYSILNQEKLPPTFCFIDPFGYSIDIKVIRDIISEPMSEIFVNFMIYDVIRALNNPSMEDTLKNLYGDEKYKEIKCQSPEEKQEYILSLYCENLQKYTGVKYILPFRVNTPNTQSRPRFYLIHLSNNVKALKTMKNRMVKFSTTDFKLEALGKKKYDLCIFDIFDEIDFKNQLYDYIMASKSINYTTLEDWAYENTCGISKTIKLKIMELECEEKIKIDRLPRQRKSTVNREARISINE